MTLDPARLAAALAVLLLYTLFCTAIGWRERRRIRRKEADARRLRPARAGVAPLLVAYASQTGFAEQLAWQTADLLHTAGEPTLVLPLRKVRAEDLAGASRALFLVSTYGEGDPPDDAAAFVRRVMDTAPPLAHLRHAVLALGDAQYARFCGFGRALDDWLQASGAQPLFGRIEVDNADPAALERWWRDLGHVAAIDAPVVREEAPFAPWTLATRRHLNPGSAGEAIHHLELVPPPGLAPTWESGDLAQVQLPQDPGRPREYSIASIPQDGRVHLLVRLERRTDGSPGAASGLLCEALQPGQQVAMRLRAHRNFRLEDNAQRPLILIGNGSGLAGLRGHLRARAAAGSGPNWLLFGERSAAHDFHYRDEILAWQADGLLQRLDLAFSRDQAERIYVQHRLAEAADTLRDWVGRGAAVYVCGSLKGMAQEVDATLEAILGHETVDDLREAGRLRRDVY